MFGEYRVVKSLGKGGMGEVWLLEIEERQEFYAVKILDPELAVKDRECRKRFLREAELAMSITHPNLIKVFDVGQDPETELCYLLMEYVPGGSLSDRLGAVGKFSIEDALRITYQVADALDCISGHGVVHRDIKSDNILFSADGKVKITDLGIARQSINGIAMTMTQAGVAMGTPAYMAPEQLIDAHNVDIRADIYSLGIVLFEMLAGERPYVGDTVVQLIAKALRGEPIPDVRTIRREVPVEVAKLVNTMCAMEAESRTSTPREVMLAISSIFYGTYLPAKNRSLEREQPCSSKKALKYSFVESGFKGDLESLSQKFLKYSFSLFILTMVAVFVLYGVRNYNVDERKDVVEAPRDVSFSRSSNVTYEKKHDQTNSLNTAIKVAVERQKILKKANSISENSGYSSPKNLIKAERKPFRAMSKIKAVETTDGLIPSNSVVFDVAKEYMPALLSKQEDRDDDHIKDINEKRSRIFMEADRLLGGLVSQAINEGAINAQDVDMSEDSKELYSRVRRVVVNAAGVNELKCMRTKDGSWESAMIDLACVRILSAIGSQTANEACAIASRKCAGVRFGRLEIEYLVKLLERNERLLFSKYFKARKDEMSAGRLKEPVDANNAVALFSIAVGDLLFDWFSSRGVAVSEKKITVTIPDRIRPRKRLATPVNVQWN